MDAGAKIAIQKKAPKIRKNQIHSHSILSRWLVQSIVVRRQIMKTIVMQTDFFPYIDTVILYDDSPFRKSGGNQ